MTDAELLSIYKNALEDIAYRGTDKAAALAGMPDEIWYRRVCLGMVSTAARALRGERDPDDDAA